VHKSPNKPVKSQHDKSHQKLPAGKRNDDN